MVVVKFNGRELQSRGLICCMDSSEGGHCIFDVVENTKCIDASGCVRVNGKEMPDAYVSIDTERGKGEFDSGVLPWEELDLSKVHVEVNIFGEIATE